MEKLLTKYDNMYVLKDLCTTDQYGYTYDCKDCKDICKICEKAADGTGCKDCPIQKAFDRLAAYENTGLAPNQIMQMQKEISPQIYTWEKEPHDLGEMWQKDTHATIEDCIQEAKEGYKIKPGETIIIGTIEPYEVTIHADWVTDALEEDAYDKCGEAAENWNIHTIGKDAFEELSEQLTKCVKEWLERHNNMPYFYKVTNPKEIVVS